VVGDGGRPATLPGIYHAIVERIEDAPGGRVRVRLPWLPGGEREQTRAAAVIVPVAAARSGVQHLPDPGDAVLVMFVAGDVDQPLVLGGSWSEAAAPPAHDEASNDVRVVRSRSGHRLAFDDSARPRAVLCDGAGRHLVACGVRTTVDHGVGQVPPARALTRSAGRGVSIGALCGDLEIDCRDGTLAIRGAVVELGAGGALHLAAGGSLTLRAGAGTAIGADGRCEIAGSPIALGASG
jgi:hypothetical protein